MDNPTPNSEPWWSRRPWIRHALTWITYGLGLFSFSSSFLYMFYLYVPDIIGYGPIRDTQPNDNIGFAFILFCIGIPIGLRLFRTARKLQKQRTRQMVPYVKNQPMYGCIGFVILFMSCCTAVSFCFASLKLQPMIVAGWLFSTYLIYFLYFRGNESALGAIEVLRSDRRPPVLYLRSFGDDQSYEVNTSQFRFHVQTSDSQEFEFNLCHELQRYGPVVAIGFPNEVASPRGSARLYVGDTWEEDVARLIQFSRLVVMLVGDTSGVLSEVRKLVAMGALSKTLFVLPPVGLIELNVRWRSLRSCLTEEFGINLPEQPPHSGVVLQVDAGRKIHFTESPRIKRRSRSIGYLWSDYRRALESAETKVRPDQDSREEMDRLIRELSQHSTVPVSDTRLPVTDGKPKQTQDEPCGGCYQRIKASDWTCPHCGYTNWVQIGVAGFLSPVCFAWAIIAWFNATSGLWRFVHVVGGTVLGSLIAVITVQAVVVARSTPYRKPAQFQDTTPAKESLPGSSTGIGHHHAKSRTTNEGPGFNSKRGP